MDAATIIKSIESVTAKWTKQRKQEERGRAQSRRAALTSCRGPSIKEAAWYAMNDAYLKASDQGTLPASARQIYYAARKQIMEATGKREVDSRYFTQMILPEYISSHRAQTANWDVTYDARGHFAEPHTRVITPLGTLDVRRYLANVNGHTAGILTAAAILTDLSVRFPTSGPENRFSAVVFIEKEGFLPLFAAAQLAERYDIAIMSTKGMPVVACRYLADELCGRYGIPLLVLHDFDKAGFSILGTLTGDNMDLTDEGHNRYEFRHEFEVIDLGLRLTDVRAYKLESEPVGYKSDPSVNLEANGAEEEEIAFLRGEHQWRVYQYQGQRVELNAFTSREFITWIEASLKRHGIKKVVPDADTLGAAYRRAVQIALVREQLDGIIDQASKQAENAKLPKDLDKIVRKGLKSHPAQSWDDVITAVAQTNCKKHAAEGHGSKQAKTRYAASKLTKGTRR
jgi:hypothetical protein